MKTVKYRYLCAIFILIASAILSGCSNKNASSSDGSDSMLFAFMDSRVFQNPAIYNVKTVERLPFSEIVEIAADDEYIYFLDKGMNCIHVTDTSGQLLRRIGSVGNAEGELLSPTAFCVTKDSIHVADHGNRRIQQFDKTGKAIATFSLRFLPERAECDNLVYTQDGYLISVISGENDPTVYFAKSSDAVVPLMKKTNGIFAMDSDSVFYIESGEFVKAHNGYGFTSGKNTVYRFNDAKLQKINDKFAHGYSIGRGTCQHQGKWYAFSTSYSSIDRFDEAWNYEETVLDLSKSHDKAAAFLGAVFAMDDSGRMFVFAPRINQLLIISKNNEK